MKEFLKQRKQQKIESITLNVMKYPEQYTSKSPVLQHFEEMEVDDGCNDEVLCMTHNEEGLNDETSSAESSDESDQEEWENLNETDDVSDVLVKTKSGRTCWSWRSWMYR